MKILALIFLVCHPIFCQIGQIEGHINLIDSKDYKYINVVAEKDSLSRSSTVDDNGNFKIIDLPYGKYILKINQLGDRGHTEELNIDNEIITLNLNYPNCPFAKKGKKPKCLDGHQDKIIPTIYGLPNQKILKKAKKGSLHLGGCEIYSDCNSFYFCTIHNKEL